MKKHTLLSQCNKSVMVHPILPPIKTLNGSGSFMKIVPSFEPGQALNCKDTANFHIFYTTTAKKVHTFYYQVSLGKIQSRACYSVGHPVACASWLVSLYSVGCSVRSSFVFCIFNMAHDGYFLIPRSHIQLHIRFLCRY